MIIELDPGDIPTWIGAIGTLAAFIVAFMQIRTERNHRKRFELHDWLAAKREHADQVTAWIGGGKLIIANGSNHLIHDVEVVLSDDHRIEINHVEPGRHVHDLAEDDLTRPVDSIAFTDARGDEWVRHGTERPELVGGPDAHHHRQRKAAVERSLGLDAPGRVERSTQRT